MCCLSYLDDSLCHLLALVVQVICFIVDNDANKVMQVVITEELEGFVSVRKLLHSVTREQLSVLQEFAIGVNEDSFMALALVSFSSIFVS